MVYFCIANSSCQFFKDCLKGIFLIGGSGNKSQNTNEALHNLIWKFSPKTIFSGRNTLETAVLLALCQFSIGKCFKDILCKILGYEPGKYWIAETLRSSTERLKKAECKSSE